MKKIVRFMALVIALAMTLSIGFTTAFASVRTETLMEDSFSNSDYEGALDDYKWNGVFTTETATIKQKDVLVNPSLQFVKGKTNSGLIQYGTKSKLTDIQSVEYALFVPYGTGDSPWFSLSFAPKVASAHEVAGVYVYDAPIMVNARKTGGQRMPVKTWLELVGAESLEGRWVGIKLIPKSDTELDAYFALGVEDESGNRTYAYPADSQMTIKGFHFGDIHDEFKNDPDKDQKIAEATAKRIADEGWSYKNAHLIWGNEGLGHDQRIDDIKIVSTGIDENGDPITLETVNTFDSLIIENNQFTAYLSVGSSYSPATSYKIAEDNKLLLEKVKKGDRAISYGEVLEDESVTEGVKVLDVTFDLQLTGTDGVGFAFAVDGESGDPTQNGVVYSITADGDGEYATGKFTEYRDGEVFSEQTKPHTLGEVAYEYGVGGTLEFTIYKDGTVTVAENGHEFSEKFVADRYAGNFGFIAVKDNVGTVLVDNVIVNSSTYYVPHTKSVTHNFENDFFGNKGHEDFYVTGVGGKLTATNGKLFWDNCADNTFFGSAHEYDAFIMDYQICSIDVSEGKTEVTKWIGLDLSRKKKMESQYGSYAMIHFQIVPENDYVQVYFYSSAERGSTFNIKDVSWQYPANGKGIPASLFRAVHFGKDGKTESDILAGDAVCIRWVSDPTEKSLKLYAKKYSEIEYTLYYEVYGLDLTGYFALTCTGWTTMKLDNFSMANTSPIYTVANNETPETITNTIYKDVYTKPDVDVNLNEELRLNTSAGNGIWFLLGGVVIGIAGIVVGFILFRKGSKD